MRTLDRYVIREVLGPFSLALGLFTFLFAIRPMLESAQSLLAKGIDVPTVGFLLLLLLPQALGITIPMAFMAAVLMALGRLSGDREAVAMLACGISPMRVLRPLLILGLAAGGLNMYTLVRLVPDSNQRFREETLRLLVSQSEGEIKAGMFYEGFPGKVLYVREILPGGAGWAGVLLADVSQPGRPIVTLAERGHLETESEKRQVAIVLPGPSVRYVTGAEEGVYDIARSENLRFAVPAESVFGNGNLTLSRGRAEMSVADLRNREGVLRASGYSPHLEIMQRHQMFSFPVACLVFAIVGLALGLHTRKEGKLGGFALGIAVICVYYGLMELFTGLVKGNDFPAEWARWMPNIILGIVGLLAVRWRARSTGRELTIPIPSWLRWKTRGVGTDAGPGPSRVVIVIRVPNIHLPRPRLLDLYVARRYLSVVSLSFAGMLVFYYIATFIDKSERLFKGQANPLMLAEYFLYSTPQFLAYIVPAAILVAALATIGGLTRTGELVVMRSCGVSLYRAAAPLLVLALVWSGGLFLLDDRVLARANRKAEALEDVIKGNPPRLASTVTHANWRTDKGRIIYFMAYDAEQQRVHGLSIFETALEPFRLVSHTRATTVTATKDGWRADGGWTQRFSAGDKATRDSFKTRILNLPSSRNFPGVEGQDNDLMTFGDLRRRIVELSDSGLALASSRVELHERIAFPLVAVVMTFLGIPFGAITGRRGALYGMGLAVVLGSGYWLVNTFFLAVGQAALLPAPLAAWAANLMFLAVALYMTFTVRT